MAHTDTTVHVDITTQHDFVSTVHWKGLGSSTLLTDTLGNTRVQAEPFELAAVLELELPVPAFNLRRCGFLVPQTLRLAHDGTENRVLRVVCPSCALRVPFVCPSCALRVECRAM